MLKITPIATTLDIETFTALADDPVTFPHGFSSDAMPADALSEFAGRACYQSWTRPNPATATNEGYLSNILDHGHFSVLEHASITLYVEGVSRSLTHELVRHRHFSFSQLSQRFVDESNVTFVVPPAIRDLLIDTKGMTAQEVEDGWQDQDFFQEIRAGYAEIVEALTTAGLDRKQIREAARAVLPNCTETKVVITGNLRTWREFISKRNADGVDAEMREFAAECLRVIRRAAPNAFQDFAA